MRKRRTIVWAAFGLAAAVGLVQGLRWIGRQEMPPWMALRLQKLRLQDEGLDINGMATIGMQLLGEAPIGPETVATTEWGELSFAPTIDSPYADRFILVRFPDSIGFPPQLADALQSQTHDYLAVHALPTNKQYHAVIATTSFHSSPLVMDEVITLVQSCIRELSEPAKQETVD